MKRIKFLGAIVLITMFIMQFSASDISAQGVGINATGASPGNSAMLDVSSASKGMLIPRVALQSVSDASTISSPATSLLVYNSGTGGLSPAGYYYNSGTPAAPVWTKFVTGSSASGWSITGNAATDSTINFVGTTDAEPLVIETNGAERMRINAAGTGIGTATPQSTLDVNGSLATRSTTATINSNSLITVGNSSHIIITSTGATSTTPWLFTLSNGQPGQYLVLELQSGYGAVANSGNVKLTTPYATFLSPYSVLYLKWDNASAAWVELSRNGFLTSSVVYYGNKQVFTYLGANQSFTVPPYVNQVFVKMWGAAGGSSNVGGVYAGSGAFVSGYLTVTPGSTLTVIVGGGGQTGTNSAAISGGFGGGGAAKGDNGTSSWYTGSGGGRSAIQVTPGIDTVTVGGGGGSGGHFQSAAPTGGGGGATTGQDGGTGVSGSTSATGKGGTILAGGGGGSNGTDVGVAIGVAGSSQTGGAGGQSTYTGGGGGGGYFGGGGGAGAGALTRADGGGGGGSSYTTNLTTVTNTPGSSSSGGYAPNTGDVDYVAGVGMNATIGGGGPGGNGLVVIYW